MSTFIKFNGNVEGIEKLMHTSSVYWLQLQGF